MTLKPLNLLEKRIQRKMTGKRRPPTGYYACVCGDPTHYLHLWIDDLDDVDADYDIDISFGWHYLPFKLRLRHAWRVITGQPTTYGTVMLDHDVAESFAEELLRSVDVRRDNRQRNLQSYLERKYQRNSEEFLGENNGNNANNPADQG